MKFTAWVSNLPMMLVLSHAEATTGFSWPASVITQYATPAPSISTTQYALPYSAIRTQFKVSTSSWPNWTPGILPLPLPTASKYDAAAFSNLWNAANPADFTRGTHSATVSPTPVPSSELVVPPGLVFNPRNASQRFPRNFILGAAGSSGQCEGAVADEGKSPSLLDMLYSLFKLDPGLAGSINGGSSIVPSGPLSPDYITNEHYYLYQQDIERFAAIGLRQYSFSIPMGRVLPFASPDSPVNSQALQHYSDLVDFALARGLEPIVTLHHWETPLQFYNGGGFIPFAASLANALTNATYGVVPGFSFGFQNSTFEDAYVH